MTVDTEEILKEILGKINNVMDIRTSDIPNIDLYMDQVTTFMDEKLKGTLRQGDSEEKILTKTMINNYAKNDLLPPPLKKKYTKEHMMVLIFVYYLKSFLTISDIQALLNPLTDMYFGKEGTYSLEEVYEEIFGAGEDRIQNLEADLKDKYLSAESTFTDAPEEEVEFLRTFAYICFLSYDVFIKKMMIERLIDEITLKQKLELEEKEAKRKEEGKRKRKEKDEVE